MTEALKCPDCSAPLTIPEGGAASIVCPYCNTTVLVPGRSQSAGAAGAQHTGAHANQLEEIARRLRAGDKIGAIRIYREIYQVSLTEALKAVEQHERNGGLGPIAAPTTSYRPVKPNAGVSIANTIGCIGAAIGIVVAIAVPILTMTMRRQTVIKPIVNIPAFPKNFTPNLPNVPGVGKSTPGFAHMTLEFGTEGIGAGGFNDSRAIAVDNQGHIFVGEYSDGRVQVFDMNGKFLTAWTTEKDKALMALVADRKGIVYAVSPWKIYRYDGMTGNKLGVLEYARDDQFGGSYNDVFIALNGKLYAIGNNHDLVTISTDGIVSNTINLKEKVGENVSFSRAIVIGTGEIYALDRDKGVFKFAADGRYINRFGGNAMKSRDFMRGAKPGQLYSPRDIAVDGKGRIYVADSNAIQVFDDEGTFLGSFGNDVVFGLAITDQNEILSCFRNKHKVRKFMIDEK